MRKNAAIGIILNENRSKVLLVKRQDIPFWVLPGGGIEDGENATDSVVREVFEETGLTVKVIRKAAEYSPINRLARQTEIFECQTLKGTLQKSSETAEISFFSLNDFPKNFFSLHKEWLQEILKNPSSIIQRPLKEVTYFNLAKFFVKHPVWLLRFLVTLYKKE